ncbi:MAG: hypothetical protein CMJ78_23555 [Planctomycetaceae bacterium]|nr:hypothetical protein [Planctomycetaceae bacterium]
MLKTFNERLLSILFSFQVLIASSLLAQEDGGQQQATTPEQTIREAASRSIRLLDRCATTYLEESDCLSCHHQTMALMVFKTARKAGFDIDNEKPQKQVERLFEFYDSRRERFAPKDLKYPVTPLGRRSDRANDDGDAEAPQRPWPLEASRLSPTGGRQFLHIELCCDPWFESLWHKGAAETNRNSRSSSQEAARQDSHPRYGRSSLPTAACFRIEDAREQAKRVRPTVAKGTAQKRRLVLEA